jgi:hypothetical protein
MPTRCSMFLTVEANPGMKAVWSPHMNLIMVLLFSYHHKHWHVLVHGCTHPNRDGALETRVPYMITSENQILIMCFSLRLCMELEHSHRDSHRNRNTHRRKHTVRQIRSNTGHTDANTHSSTNTRTDTERHTETHSTDAHASDRRTKISKHAHTRTLWFRISHCK